MANEIYADQLLHIIYRGAIEAVATAVEDVYRLGVRATDIETLIGENDASPTANTIMDRLKSIITNTAVIAADPATATLQTAGNASLTTIAGVDFATQTTLAAILAKIIAAPATEAKQDTGNTSLSTIAAKDFATQTTSAAILSALEATLDVAIADGDDVALGATTDTAETDPTATASAIQLIKGILKQLQGAGTGNLNISIEDAGITLPTDKQGILKTEVTYTATPLGISATYTGSWIPVSTMRRLLILLNADQTGNLYIEHSRDGSTARRVTTVAVAVSTPQGIEEICYSNYARIVYVNDATAQGSFELSVMTSAD